MRLSEVLLLGGVIVAVLAGHAMSKLIAARVGVEPIEAQKPWLRKSQVAGGLWFLSIITYRGFIRAGWIVDHPQIIAGAVLIAFLGGVAIWAYSRYLRAADEFVRRAEIESHALAFGMAIVVAASVWQLTSFGVISDWPFSRYALWVIVFPSVTSRLIVFSRYR